MLPKTLKAFQDFLRLEAAGGLCLMAGLVGCGVLRLYLGGRRGAA